MLIANLFSLASLFAGRSNKSPKICLYCRMLISIQDHQTNTAKFIRYQRPAIRRQTDCYNQADNNFINTLLTLCYQPAEIVTSQGLPIHRTMILKQQFLTHWLGVATRFTDWFTATLAMNNGLQQKKSQLMIITQDSRALIATISPVYVK